MEEKSPELRATLDLIMLSMKQFEEQITTLAKQGYIMEKHKSTLILALYNVGDMVENCIELQVTVKTLKEMTGEKHG